MKWCKVGLHYNHRNGLKITIKFLNWLKTLIITGCIFVYVVFNSKSTKILPSKYRWPYHININEIFTSVTPVLLSFSHSLVSLPFCCPAVDLLELTDVLPFFDFPEFNCVSSWIRSVKFWKMMKAVLNKNS